MDENDGTDLTLEVEKPNNISVNYVGEHLNNFNSCLVLAHFKGHPMGGFGGAMKQLSIGFASREGRPIFIQVVPLLTILNVGIKKLLN